MDSPLHDRDDPEAGAGGTDALRGQAHHHQGPRQDKHRDQEGSGQKKVDELLYCIIMVCLYFYLRQDLFVCIYSSACLCALNMM